MNNSQNANTPSWGNLQTFLNTVQQARQKHYTYNMSMADVEKIATDRLTKMGLKLYDLKTDPDWNGKVLVYKGIRMEDVPDAQKRFSYQRDWCQGELLCGISCDSSKPCLIGCDLTNVDVDFLTNGNLKASSTYIKYPIAFHLFDRNLLFHPGEDFWSVKHHILTTEKEINDWFDEFEKYYPILQNEIKLTAEAFNNVKTLGKPFKDIMKAHAKKDKEYKEARAAYEDMILNQIKRITIKDKIQQICKD